MSEHMKTALVKSVYAANQLQFENVVDVSIQVNSLFAAPRTTSRNF